MDFRKKLDYFTDTVFIVLQFIFKLLFIIVVFGALATIVGLKLLH